MKKMIIAAMAALAVLPVAAKTEVDREWYASSSESRMVQGDASLYVRPLTVEITPLAENGRIVRHTFIKDISDKIDAQGRIIDPEYTSRVSFYRNGEINIRDTEINLKSYVIYLASTGKLKDVAGNAINCDVFVAPLFNMFFNQDGCHVEFTGYPATYTNWKTATPTEITDWILREKQYKQEKRVNVGNVGVEETEVITVPSQSARGLLR